MPEKDYLEFIAALGFVVASIVLIVFAYAMQMYRSGQRLKKARRFSSSVVEFTPALMLIVFDHKNRVVAFNRTSEMLSGYSAKNILGKKPQELSFLPNIFNENNEYDNQSRGQPTFTLTTASMKAKSGRELSIEWQIREFRDSDGSTELKIVAGLDITELKLAQKKLRALTVKLSATEDRERKRIAEELHDRIGETLIVSNHKIAALKTKLSSTEHCKAIDGLSDTIHEFLKGARSLIFELIPPVLYDIGLEAAIESLATHFRKKYQIEINVEDDQEEKPVNQDIAMFMYKAIRELLLNVVKHAQAQEVRVTLCRIENTYKVVVEDNGIGFKSVTTHSENNSHSGFGLFNIKNQAEYYQGKLEIEPGAVKGSRFIISIPLNRKTEV